MRGRENRQRLVLNQAGGMLRVDWSGTTAAIVDALGSQISIVDMDSQLNDNRSSDGESVAQIKSKLILEAANDEQLQIALIKLSATKQVRSLNLINVKNMTRGAERLVLADLALTLVSNVPASN